MRDLVLASTAAETRYFATVKGLRGVEYVASPRALEGVRVDRIHLLPSYWDRNDFIELSRVVDLVSMKSDSDFLCYVMDRIDGSPVYIEVDCDGSEVE